MRPTRVTVPSALFVLALGLYFRLWQAVFVFPPVIAETSRSPGSGSNEGRQGTFSRGNGALDSRGDEAERVLRFCPSLEIGVLVAKQKHDSGRKKTDRRRSKEKREPGGSHGVRAALGRGGGKGKR